MSVVCPSCHTPAPPGAAFCDNCGYDLSKVSPVGLPPQPVYQAPPPSGDLSCPSCGHPNIAGSAFCENCGSSLAQVQLPVQPPAQPPYQPPAPPIAAPPVQPPVSPAAPTSVVTGSLVIQTAGVTLQVPPGKQTVVIGREDPVSGIFPDIDLDPYGGQEAGVGRKHAQLVAQGAQVLIEDLDSVNGTVLNKQRLAPHQPQPVKDGDEIRLGRLVLIYHSS